MNRRFLPGVLASVAVLVIALMLRDVVAQLIIRPAIYLFWLFGIYYHAIPQPVLWLLLVLALVYLAVIWLASKVKLPALNPEKPKINHGPVADLAMRIERKDRGIYFKWQIARNLGQIALDIQELHQHLRSRTLEFNERKASPQVRQYLDFGLNSSFSDYPIPRRVSASRKSKSPPTPFDGDISPVIEYLETELENEDDRRRP